MSNAYGLDFLKAEHNVINSQNSNSYESNQYKSFVPENGNVNHYKSNNEKQFEIIQFLKQHRSSGFLPPSIIYQKTGIDLSAASEDGESFLQQLLRNAKICTEEVPDPENPSIKMLTFGYQSKFSEVHDKTTLLALINRCKNGVSYNDLRDAYIGVEADLDSLITAGDILALENDTSGKDKTLFPRGEPFLVELDGHITLPTAFSSILTPTSGKIPNYPYPNMPINKLRNPLEEEKKTSDHKSYKGQIVQASRGPLNQIRRGEAIWLGGQWHRLSSSTKEGVPLSEQPPRARAPPSVVLQKDLSKKNDQDGYVFPFTEKLISGDRLLTEEAIQNLRLAASARERLSQAFAWLRTCGAANTLSARSLMNTHSTSDVASANVSSSNSSNQAGGSGSGTSTMRKRPSSHHRFGAHSNHHTINSDSNKVKSSNPTQNSKNKGLNAAQTKSAAIEAARAAAEDTALAYSFARRHGCTKDVRAMYFETKKDIPETDQELYKVLIKTKLIEEGEAMRRTPVKKKKSNVDNDGKPKKMRYYVNKKHRITNTHLDNTELGKKLEMAMERQAQGKDVGDGGM